MGVRFRRRIRIAPGIYLNLSGSGVSASVGPRGASLTFGRQGVHSNLGIPGTGLYSRDRIAGGSSRRRASSEDRGAAAAEVSIRINDDGELLILDKDGLLVSDSLARAVRRDRGEALRELLTQFADGANSALESITEVHQHTAPIDREFKFEKASFARSKPREPSVIPVSRMTRLLKRQKAKQIDAENARRQKVYEDGLRAWRHLKQRHEEREIQRTTTFHEKLLNADAESMEMWLEQRLRALDWPRETDVSFEINPSTNTVLMDVDLPEIEDMPGGVFRVPMRGWKVSRKPLSDKQRRLNYARHIHGVAFRLIGEVFASLPTAETVILSGYSQRPQKATGQIEDEYLISAKVLRESWSEIAFDNLSSVDPVEALTRFELRRKMTATGLFKAVEPIG